MKKKSHLPLPDSLLEQPGKKFITWKQYQDLLYSTYGTPEYDRLQGSNPDLAAAGLRMTKEALLRAIEQGSLDAWYVYDGYVPGVRQLKSITVTTESIARFKSNAFRRN